MKSSLLVGPLLCSVLASCAPSNPYVKPTAGPQAKLRVVSLPGDNTTILEGTKSNCVSNEGRYIAEVGQVLVIDKGAGKREGIPLIEDVPSKLTTELIIPAQGAYTVEIGAVYGGIPPISAYSWCRRAVTFVPEDGRNYEIIYRFKRPDCSATVSQIETSKDKFERVPLSSYNVTGEQCR